MCRSPVSSRIHPQRRSAARGAVRAIALLALTSLAGCASLRPQDDERLEIAEEAAQLAADLRQGQAGPFGAMEQNLGTVAAARQQVLSLLDATRKEAFLARFPQMTREQLAEELMTALGDHVTAQTQATAQVRQAAETVKEELERQATLSKTAPKDSQLASVLGEVDRRLRQLDSFLTDVSKATSTLKNLEAAVSGIQRVDRSTATPGSPTDGADGNADGGSAAPDGTSPPSADPLDHLGKTVADAQGLLNPVRNTLTDIQSDPEVLAAQRLVLQAGQEVAASEMARLTEMKRHLTVVQNVEEQLTERDRIYGAQLVLPTLGWVATDNDYRQAFTDLDLEDSFDGSLLELNRCFQKAWCDGCDLAAFVAANLALSPPADCETDDMGVEVMKMVAQVGVILFSEDQRDQQALLDLATERHRHSIRLSQINSQQRLNLVGQIAEGLRIYYQGGLAPAQAAQLILAASQVLATFYIGSEV